MYRKFSPRSWSFFVKKGLIIPCFAMACMVHGFPTRRLSIHILGDNIQGHIDLLQRHFWCCVTISANQLSSFRGPGWVTRRDPLFLTLRIGYKRWLPRPHLHRYPTPLTWIQSLSTSYSQTIMRFFTAAIIGLAAVISGVSAKAADNSTGCQAGKMASIIITKFFQAHTIFLLSVWPENRHVRFSMRGTGYKMTSIFVTKFSFHPSFSGLNDIVCVPLCMKIKGDCSDACAQCGTN